MSFSRPNTPSLTPARPQDALQAPFDFVQVLKLALRRSWKSIGLITLLATASVTWYAMGQPNTYASEGKLFLRLGSREGLTAEALVVGSADATRAQMTMQDELHLLHDDRILETVARKVGAKSLITACDPTAADGPSTSWSSVLVHKLQLQAMGDPKSSTHACGAEACDECVRAAVDFLRDTVTATADYGSTVIVVRAISYSPELARTLVDELLSTYVDRHAEKFSAKPVLAKNEPKLVEARKRRDTAVEAFYDHVNKCGIADIEAQRNATIESGQQVDQEFASAKATQSSIQAQIDALQARMDGVGQVKKIGEDKVANPTYYRLLEEQENLKIQKSGNDALVDSLGRAIAARLADVKKFSECERIHASLGGSKALEETRFSELEKRFAVLQDLTSLDDKADSNLTTLQDAALILRKVGPMRPKLIGVGAVLSLALAVWLALMRELLDRRVTHAPMVERQVGTRLLGAIPEYRQRGSHVA